MTSEIQEEPRVARSGKRRAIAAIVVVALLALLASLRGILTLYTDYLWFDDLGRTSTWTGILSAQIVLSVVFVSIFFVLAWLNLVIADRIAPALRPPGPEEELLVRWHDTVGRRNGLIRFAIAGFFALVAGGGAAAQWNEWILFTNPQDFGSVDPLFAKDLSFYVFRLPFLTFVVSWFFATFIIIGIITGIWHYINGGIRIQTVDRRSTPQVKAHLSVILAILALLKAADYYLQRFELLGSSQGFRRGAFYTDINATLPSINLLLLISLFSVGLLVANIWRRGWALPVVAVGLWALIAVLAGGIYPAVIQQFQVAPDELAREREYIELNIASTRDGLGLDSVAEEEFAFEDTPLTRDAVLRNRGVFSTVRLLDPRIVDDSFTRNQKDLDIYDDFSRKVDVDRYEIDGQLTPVVVAAREIGNQPSVSWQVRHAIRTHGYGLVLAPANRFNPNGEPNFLIGDAPIENQLEETVLIDQPQIYFGENVEQYAVTGTTENEFDFIDGYTYDGEGAIPMSSFFSRLAFAFRFGAIEPLISGIITDDTEVMFARDITERASRIAPFLQYDSNPYPIVVNGGISYVLDAYTTSDRFPYGEFADVAQLSGASGLRQDFNYVRNSVKVVVDAYDGTVDFYVVDQDDPILQAYRQEFDELFKDASEMPDEVAEHLRYPEDLFVIQTGMWGRYQLEDVGAFFTADLGWAVADNPDSRSGGAAITSLDQSDPTSPRLVPSGSRPIDPYYLVTQLPGETEPSFIIARPFVPAAVPELRAYFVGRVDRNGKLELLQYEIGSGNNVSARGPIQIDEILNSDPEISEESTELGRGGSQFLSGNLNLLLVDNAVVYVRPFYVQREPLAENPNEETEPQVKFVAVVQEDRLGFAPTYPGALAKLFDLTLEEAAALVGTTVDEIEQAGDDIPSGVIVLDDLSEEVTSRLDAVLGKFTEAENALPDFAEYQRLQDEALAELRQLLDEVESTVDEAPVDPTAEDTDSA
ncbi:MAG: uncharacterized membrane protein (UPF0182 family) [Verrucomicrobiales bacterium]|jgi:uncharacterized membrane protein (UPF0182 family)